MQQPNPQQNLTDLCIWWQANRVRAEVWASTKPTAQGVTYKPQWVDSVQLWVDGWREERKQTKPRVWLWGCYLREIGMLQKVLGEADDEQ